MRTPYILAILAATPFIAAADFYVSPQGSDTNPGTLEQPFARLEQARDAIRHTRLGRAALGAPTTVWLRGGIYPRTTPLILGTKDSGTAAAPIVYRSMAGETARLLGGRVVPLHDFRPVTDPATLARIQPIARGKVVELDLKALGIRHHECYPDVFNDSGNILELYFNGRRMPLARYPNRGYMSMKRVLDNAGGIQDRNWRTPINLQTVAPNRDGGTFEYRDAFAARHAVWRSDLERGVWLKGYWRVPWQNEAIRVKAIDPNRKTVTFAKPIPGGIGSKYHRPEGSGEEKYWLMNLLEEVDRPGEWCIEFTAAKLYFYPPAPLADGQVAIADLAEPVISLENASHVVLRQLLVENSLGHGIQVRGGANVRVAGCTVRNVSRHGVVLDGGFRHAVESCDLYDLGAGGVWLAGGDELSAPRIPAGHRVINNHIHHFASIERVYAAGVNCGFTGGGGGGHHPAVGMLVAHNLIHDTPHVGVLHGSWDNVFEYNEIHDFCEVSNDMGGFYGYDQYARNGNQTFRYNFIHSSGDGDGVYFDHDHREMHVHGNILCLNSTGRRGTGFLYKSGSQTKHPQTIDCTNNIAVNCNFGFVFVTARPSRIENNVAAMCKTPFTWEAVAQGRIVKSDEGLASGRNIHYDNDPGFVDLARLDLRLRPDATVFRDLPAFQPIPVEKIGLYLDEYRTRLPSKAEAGRVRGKNTEALGEEILDRP